MLEDTGHSARRPLFAHRAWLLVPLFVVGGLLGFRWWWDHRVFVTGLGAAVCRATESEILARYGLPKSRTTTSPGGLGVMEGTDVSYRQMFGDVPDPVVLPFYWKLPNEGRRYVWFGRVGDGPWLAFDGIEYRGVKF